MKTKSSDEEKESKGKKVKKSKEKEEKPKKKRAASGYNLFCKANRDDAKEAYIQENDMDEGEKPTNQQVMSKLGSMWSALSDDEKTEWQDKAKALAEEVEVDVE